MRILGKNFLIGFGAGVAAALVLLDLWGTHYANNYFLDAQPRLARPFLQQHLAEVMMPKSSSGLPAPWVPEANGGPHEDWRFTSLDGKVVTLGDFRGRVVFLDFWATYCSPCVQEIPGIASLAQSLKNENVAFVLVAKDGRQRVREFFKKHPLDLPVYFAKDWPPDMPSPAIPATYIVDRQGAVVLQHVGAANWDADSVRSFLRGLENQ